MQQKKSGERVTDYAAASRKTTARQRTARASGETLTKANAPASAVCTEEQIRQRAYYIYLARDGAPGDPVADWCQAERELAQTATGSHR
jgi:hypothetical protein